MAVVFPDPAVTNPYTDQYGKTWLHTNGAWRFRDSCPDVLADEFPTLGVSLSVYQRSSLLFGNSVHTILGDAIEYGDPRNFIDGEFIVPETGKYLITCNATAHAMPSLQQISSQILVAGSTKATQTHNTPASAINQKPISSPITTTSFATAGDIIKSTLVSYTTDDCIASPGLTSTNMKIEKLDRTTGDAIDSSISTRPVGDITTTAGVWEKVVYGGSIFHTHGGITHSTGDFTLPAGTSGKYYFSVSLNTSASTETEARYMQIRNQNGVLAELAVPTRGSGISGGHFSGIIGLQAGDVVSVHFYSSVARTISYSTSIFCLELLDRLIDNSVSAEYRLAADFNVSSGVLTKILFDTVENEATGGGGSNLVSGEFQVPSGYAGRYLVSANMYFRYDSADTYTIMGLYKNTSGKIMVFNPDVRGFSTIHNISGVVDTAVGDKIGLYWQTSDSGNLAQASSLTHLRVEYLGA